MPLSVRAWNCEACGTVHDRDVNAALNILAVGRSRFLVEVRVRLNAAQGWQSAPIDEARILAL